ncbi:hypothetical protein AKJ16_DCAP17236, partial [Drosera capensis]
MSSLLIWDRRYHQHPGDRGDTIHIALASISIGTSFPWIWKLMTSFAPPTNLWPMKIAGTLGLAPSLCSAFSISLPIGIWSSSYTIGCNRCSWQRSPRASPPLDASKLNPLLNFSIGYYLSGDEETENATLFKKV